MSVSDCAVDVETALIEIVIYLQVRESTYELKEGGVRLQLTMVDTPGFGDNVDNTDW